MHSMEVGDYMVNYNSDFSGEVYLTNHLNKVNHVIPFEVFEALVAEKLRVSMISKIEQMTDGELLGKLVSK